MSPDLTRLTQASPGPGILIPEFLSLLCFTASGLFSSGDKWGPLSSCGVQGSHRAGFCCGEQVQSPQASAEVAQGLSSFGSWALEHRLSSCGPWT